MVRNWANSLTGKESQIIERVVESVSECVGCLNVESDVGRESEESLVTSTDFSKHQHFKKKRVEALIEHRVDIEVNSTHSPVHFRPEKTHDFFSFHLPVAGASHQGLLLSLAFLLDELRLPKSRRLRSHNCDSPRIAEQLFENRISEVLARFSLFQRRDDVSCFLILSSVENA